MQLRLPRSERGDTIVEVLIAIAVVSGVLGTSYAIVSRNNKSYQQVNEHTDALKLAEAQFEQIRKAGADPLSPYRPTIFAPNATFCFDNTTATPVLKTAVPCVSQGRYKVTVTKPGTERTFNVSVTWEGINSNTDSVGLSYKVYE